MGNVNSSNATKRLCKIQDNKQNTSWICQLKSTMIRPSRRKNQWAWREIIWNYPARRKENKARTNRNEESHGTYRGTLTETICMSAGATEEREGGVESLFKSNGWELLKCGRDVNVSRFIKLSFPLQKCQSKMTFSKIHSKIHPICHRATKPTHHNYWDLHTLEPMLATREATAIKSPCTTTRATNLHSPQLERAHAQQQWPTAVKEINT